MNSQTRFATHFAPLTLVNFWQCDGITLADKIMATMTMRRRQRDIVATAKALSAVIALYNHKRPSV